MKLEGIILGEINQIGKKNKYSLISIKRGILKKPNSRE